MAKLLLHFFFFFLLFIISTTTTTLSPEKLLWRQKTVSKKATAMHEKLSHLRFYWHDIQSGPNPTSLPIASSPTTNASSTFFGLVNIIDNPLTLGPTMISRLVGRAQGFYASASQETVGLMMAMNLAFTEGKYNGSTITVTGRNEVFAGVREMPVVGGSGLFRSARGYVQLKTSSLNMKTRDAVVQYDCFIMHYSTNDETSMKLIAKLVS